MIETDIRVLNATEVTQVSGGSGSRAFEYFVGIAVGIATKNAGAGSFARNVVRFGNWLRRGGRGRSSNRSSSGSGSGGGRTTDLTVKHLH